LKKFILISLLLTSLYSDAKIYLGAGYSGYVENLNDSDLTNTSSAYKIKAGYGIRNSFAVEFSVDYIDNTISTDAPWSAKYGFNIELIKAFDFGIYVNPFIKAGFGAGIIDNRANDFMSKSYGSFNTGLGMYIPLSTSYDIEVSYSYNNLSYEKNEADKLQSYNQTSHVNSLYIGINTRF